ncbi:unnamed protein product [Phaeothamnion confervicola]
MKTHEELCVYLDSQGLLRNPTIAAAVRKVDRGDFVPPLLRPHVYIDQPVRAGNVHVSAPFIYATALEALAPAPGASFLNIGSGTGYFSYLVSLLTGESAVNHGVELLPELVAWAKKCVAAVDERLGRHTDIQLVAGNGLCIEPSIKYDAIYVGAGCSAEKTRSYLFGLLRVNGVMVAPFGDELLKVCRTGESTFKMTVLASVCFSQIIMPAAGSSNGNGNNVPKVRFADKQWSPRSHFTFPKPFQETVLTLLLVNSQPPEETMLARLPPSLLLEVMSFMHRDWFEEAAPSPIAGCAGQKCLYGALQRITGASPSRPQGCIIS